MRTNLLVLPRRPFLDPAPQAPVGWPPDAIPNQIIASAHINQIRDSVYQWPGDVFAADHALSGLRRVQWQLPGQFPNFSIDGDTGIRLGASRSLLWAQTDNWAEAPIAGLLYESASAALVMNPRLWVDPGTNPYEAIVVRPGAGGPHNFRVDADGTVISNATVSTVYQGRGMFRMGENALRMPFDSTIKWSQTENWFDADGASLSYVPGFAAVIQPRLSVFGLLTLHPAAGANALEVYGQSGSKDWYIDSSGHLASQTFRSIGGGSIDGITGRTLQAFPASGGNSLILHDVAGAAAWVVDGNGTMLSDWRVLAQANAIRCGSAAQPGAMALGADFSGVPKGLMFARDQTIQWSNDVNDWNATPTVALRSAGPGALVVGIPQSPSTIQPSDMYAATFRAMVSFQITDGFGGWKVGASGTYVSADGKTVTVKGGMTISIV